MKNMDFEDLVFQFEPPTGALHPYPPAAFQSFPFQSFGTPMLQDSAQNIPQDPHNTRGLFTASQNDVLAPPQAGKATTNPNDGFGHFYAAASHMYAQGGIPIDRMEATVIPTIEEAYSPAASSVQSGEPELNLRHEEPLWRAATGDAPHQQLRLTPFSENGTTTTWDEDEDDEGASDVYRKRKSEPETKARASKRAKTSDTSNLWEVGPNGSASEAAGEGSTEDLHPSSTDKRKDLRSTKPGYPYYGAEHSANPPPFVSTPIPCPDIGLHALVEPEGDERPGYNYTTLIKCAILGSPAKRLTIDEMYEQLMGKFEYYRKNDGKTDKGWKNSVRHHLSLSACFVKEEKKIWESGKGSWWTVDLNANDTDLKRTRKRKPRTKAYVAAQNALKQQQELERQNLEDSQRIENMETVATRFDETVTTQSTQSTNIEELSRRPILPLPSSTSNTNRKLSIAALTGPSIFSVNPAIKVTGPTGLQDNSRDGIFTPASYRRNSGSLAETYHPSQEVPSMFRPTTGNPSLDRMNSLGHAFSNERTTATFYDHAQPSSIRETRRVSLMDWSPNDNGSAER